MKTYTVTLTAGEFWQAQMALETRLSQLEASKAAIDAAGLESDATNEFVFDTAQALRRVKATRADSSALSRMLLAPKGPRR